MSIHGGVDKEAALHKCDGLLLSHKKEWNNAICNMDRPTDCHTEWSKSDRKRQISYDITYMWNLKKKKMVQMNLFTKQKYSHRYRKQTYSHQVGKGRRDKLGDWDRHIYTTIYKTDS